METVLHFEHLVAADDPRHPLAAPLTRDQIWQGLVLRVREPAEFVPGLDEAVITAQGEGWIERTLRYGAVCIHDRVTLAPRTRVTITTPAAAGHAGGSLTMTIETGQAGAACIRFVYDTTLPGVDETGDARIAETVKSAYREADLDTVRRIREMAAAGRLG